MQTGLGTSGVPNVGGVTVGEENMANESCRDVNSVVESFRIFLNGIFMDEIRLVEVILVGSLDAMNVRGESEESNVTISGLDYGLARLEIDENETTSVGLHAALNEVTLETANKKGKDVTVVDVNEDKKDGLVSDVKGLAFGEIDGLENKAKGLFGDVRSDVELRERLTESIFLRVGQKVEDVQNESYADVTVLEEDRRVFIKHVISEESPRRRDRIDESVSVDYD